MPGFQAFDANAERYDDWFDRHDAAYVAELLALRPFVPLDGRGLEIGVGSGRFAGPLGVGAGVDPSPAMLARARARGIDAVQAVAEDLPFGDDSFDHALVVTTLCFVDSPEVMLAEARRVLRPSGTITIGFIDLASPLGQRYERHKRESVFYRDARFHTADDVERLLVAAGFRILAWAQTLCDPVEPGAAIEAARPGRGLGAFVVVQAGNRKPMR